MIVSHRFVFLHLHKSGGTFVNQLLLRCVPQTRMLGYHLPYRVLPEDFRALPVLGTVRNPWAYYVSWYHFQAGMARPNPLFLIASDNRACDFNGTVRNLLTLHENPQRVADLKAAFPDHFVNFGLNLTRSCIAAIENSGLGFYSFLYNRLYEGAQAPEILGMEDLRGALRRCLAEHMFQPMPQVEHFLAEAPALNTTQHGPYTDYYDAETRDLVARHDALVITRHGYSY